MVLRQLNGEQRFFLGDGTPVNSLKTLARILPEMRDVDFRKHVSHEKNDFANWVLGVHKNKELASQMLQAGSRTELAQLLKETIDSHEAKTRIDALPQILEDHGITNEHPAIKRKDERDKKTAHESLLDEIQQLTEENSVLRATIIHLEKDIKMMTKKLSSFNINLRSEANRSVVNQAQPQKQLNDYPMATAPKDKLTNTEITVKSTTIESLLDNFKNEEQPIDPASLAVSVTDRISPMQLQEQTLASTIEAIAATEAAAQQVRAEQEQAVQEELSATETQEIPSPQFAPQISPEHKKYSSAIKAVVEQLMNKGTKAYKVLTNALPENQEEDEEDGALKELLSQETQEQTPESEVQNIVEEFKQEQNQIEQAQGDPETIDFASIAEEFEMGREQYSGIGEQSLLADDADSIVLESEDVEEESFTNAPEEETQTLGNWFRNFFGIKKEQLVDQGIVDQIIQDARAPKKKRTFRN